MLPSLRYVCVVGRACMCACMCAYMLVCVRAYVRACVRVCVFMRMCVRVVWRACVCMAELTQKTGGNVENGGSKGRGEERKDVNRWFLCHGTHCYVSTSEITRYMHMYM